MPNEPKTGPSVPYELPTRDQAQWWEDRVIEAIHNKDLMLERNGPNDVHLHGRCPRCEHQMSNVLPIAVIVFRTVDGPGGEVLRAEVVCTCRVDPPHSKEKDIHGCGYGKNLTLHLPGSLLPK